MGIDLGSTSTEAVVLDDNGEIVTYKIIDTEPNHKTCTENILVLVYRELSAIYNTPVTQEDIQFCIGTGYGRENIFCAGKTVSEISCHARGVHYYFPSARSIIDIGGQDSKVITIDGKGEVIDFVMNEKCAAGTGRFLEAIGDVCEISLDQLGPISLKAEKEAEISSMCTVFAESEVISKLADGEEKESVIKGLHSAITFRVLSMGKRIGIKAPLVFTGGVARNSGMVRMLMEKTGFDKKDVRVPPVPQIVGGLGAAFFARDQWNSRKKGQTTVYIKGKPSQEIEKIISNWEKEIPAKIQKPGKNGRDVIGWTDLAVPVELLSAANIKHIRITGDIEKGASSDRYIRTYSCAYIKNAVSALLEESEKYDFLEGVITTNCCSATEKMSDVLKCHDGPNDGLFIYPLTVPRLTGDEAVDYMRKNIVAFKTFLENKYRTTITTGRLRTTCKKYNEAKRLMNEFTMLAARNNVSNTARLLAIQLEKFWGITAGDGIDIDGFCADLKDKINRLKAVTPLEKQGPNMLLAGSLIPELKFYDIFDNIPCQVVYNNTSSGNKFSESSVDLAENDIYHALARRCLYYGYTPRTMAPASRMDHIKNLVEQYNIEGIIFNITKFCVYYTFESVVLKEYCEEWKIPLLVIETDFTSKSLGQLKTRIEAFIETFNSASFSK